MHRRTRPARRKSSPLRWLGWLAALIVIAAVTLNLLAPTLVTHFIRAYVQKEAFRQKAEEWIAAKTGGRSRIDALTWNDDNAQVSELLLENAHGWDVEAVGLHAALDFGAIRTGVWSIHSAGADEFTLRRSASAMSNLETPLGSGDAVDSIPSLLRRHIPTKTDISGFDVRSFNFEQAGWKMADTNAKAGAWESGKTSVPVKLSGGTACHGYGGGIIRIDGAARGIHPADGNGQDEQGGFHGDALGVLSGAGGTGVNVVGHKIGA
jgi:hypothetical protein